MNNPRIQATLLIVITGFLFWWKLGTLGLIDPDEPFYAQTTREMVQANDWVTPQIFGQPQFEKPIFFYWQTMAAQKIFGDNEFASRFPSAFFATALVFLTWAFGRRLLSPWAGFLAALILSSGMIYIFMARLMLTDISLAFFITASLYCLWRALEDDEHRDRWVILQLVASGFATLTKGPLGVLLPTLGSIAFLWFTGSRSPWRGRGLWLGVAAWLVIVVPWYGAMFAKFGKLYWQKFFVLENFGRFITAEHPRNNEIAGHYIGGIHYYPLMLLVGSLPWMPLVAGAALRGRRAARANRGMLFIACWGLPTLAFMTLAQSKLPSYIFFLFVPLALAMGHTLEAWWAEGLPGRLERWVAGILAVAQGVALIVATYIKPDFADIRVAALIISAPLLVAAALLLAQRMRGWTIASAVASCTVIAMAFTLLAPKLEALSSSKAIVQKIESVRRPKEPIVTVKFMVRAIAYYDPMDFSDPETLKSQLVVEAADPHPWYSGHPITVLVGDQKLGDFIDAHQSALFVTQVSDWKSLNAVDRVFSGRCEKLETIGDRIIFRIEGKKK